VTSGLRSSTEIHLARNVVGPVLLAESEFGGQLRLEVLVAAHHLLTTYRRADAFLIIVGPVLDAAFVIALQRYADELNLTRTWLAPGADAATVDAFRSRADAHLRWDPEWAAAGAALLADALTDLLEPVGSEGVLRGGVPASPGAGGSKAGGSGSIGAKTHLP
jgi:hypothetical protein